MNEFWADPQFTRKGSVHFATLFVPKTEVNSLSHKPLHPNKIGVNPNPWVYTPDVNPYHWTQVGAEDDVGHRLTLGPERAKTTLETFYAESTTERA